MKEKNKDKIRVSVWLSEAENEKLKLSAKLCGLSESEFVRQLCKGKTPKPQPTKEFWEMKDVIIQNVSFPIFYSFFDIIFALPS